MSSLRDENGVIYIHFFMKPYIKGNRVILRADANVTAEQLLDHELYHRESQRNKALNGIIREALANNMDEQELRETAKKAYAEAQTGERTPVEETRREPTPGVDPRAENDAQRQEEQQRREEQQAREDMWFTAPPVVDLEQGVPGDLAQGEAPEPRETLERDTPEEITAEDVHRQQEEDRRQADENGEGAPFIETGERTPVEEARREPTPGTDPRQQEAAQLEAERQRADNKEQAKKDRERKAFQQERNILNDQSKERQNYLKSKFEQYRETLEKLKTGDEIIAEGEDKPALRVLSVSENGIVIESLDEDGNTVTIERILPDSFTGDTVISILDLAGDYQVQNNAGENAQTTQTTQQVQQTVEDYNPVPPIDSEAGIPAEINNAISGTQKKTGVTFLSQTVEFKDGDGNTVAAFTPANISELTGKQQDIARAVDSIARTLGLEVMVGHGRGDLGGAYVGGGKIYLNIDSGMNLQNYSKAIAAASFGHEMTHWLKEYAPAEYEALQQVLTGNLTEEQLSALIDEQIRMQPGLSREAALDEVLANACQPLLQDSKAFEQLAQQNPTLAQRILDFIKEFLDKIRKAFSEVDFHDNIPIFHAAQALEQHLEEMQQAFDKAIVAARENMKAESTEEALAYVVPNNTDKDVLQDLQDRRFNVLTYEAGNEQDRLEKINSVEGAQFQTWGEKDNKNTAHEGGVQFQAWGDRKGVPNSKLEPISGELRESLTSWEGNHIIQSHEDVVNIVNDVFDNPGKRGTAYFGIVNPDTLNEIQAKATNVPRDLQGNLFAEEKSYILAAEYDKIAHLTDKENKRKLSREETVELLDRMADIILDNDTVKFSYYTEKGQKTPGLLFEKDFGDGTYGSYNLISRGRQRLGLKTLYIEGRDSTIQINKKKPSSQPLVNNPQPTSETTGSQTSSMDIVTDTEEKSNPKNEPLFQTWDGSEGQEAQREEARAFTEGIDIMPEAGEEAISSANGLTEADNADLDNRYRDNGDGGLAALFGPTVEEQEIRATDRATKEGNDALRDRILRTQSQIDSLKRLDRNPGTRLTEQQRAHIEDLQETLDILVEESNARKGKFFFLLQHFFLSTGIMGEKLFKQRGISAC